MQIDDIEYRDAQALTKVLADNVFRWCRFTSLEIEGGHIDSTFLGCTFKEVDWYWGIFNCCVFVKTKFVGCIFRGTSFPDCRFVDCDFIECQFLEDNLNGKCTAEGARTYGSSAKDCVGAEVLFGQGAL